MSGTFILLGRRIARVYAGHDATQTQWASQRCIYDGVTLIEDRLYDQTLPDDGKLLGRYFYEAAINKLVSVQIPTADGLGLNEYIALTDDRGTIMGTADVATGDVLERLYYNSTGIAKVYDANDQPILRADGRNLGHSQYIPFGYTGMYKESFTGFLHTHFRDYDPIHRTWLSEDPAGYADGLNLNRAYFDVNGADVLGLDTDESVSFWRKWGLDVWTIFDVEGYHRNRRKHKNISSQIKSHTSNVTGAIELSNPALAHDIKVLMNKWKMRDDKLKAQALEKLADLPKEAVISMAPAPQDVITGYYILDLARKTPNLSSYERSELTKLGWFLIACGTMDAIDLGMPDGGDGFQAEARSIGKKVISEFESKLSHNNVSFTSKSIADDAAQAVAREPKRIFSARELMRRVEEPGPMHNFPASYDAEIFSNGTRTVVKPDYVEYTLPGTITLEGSPIFKDGKRVGETPGRVVEGVYEIGVRPSPSGRNEVITHRFFRANAD